MLLGDIREKIPSATGSPMNHCLGSPLISIAYLVLYVHKSAKNEVSVVLIHVWMTC